LKPTKEDLLRAAGKTVPEVLAPGLRVLFCGINPGLYSGAVGHHFARPGNRFWPVLYASGFTNRLLSPFEDRDLLTVGCGITNLVDRATVAADELTSAELEEGGKRLEEKVTRYRPKVLAVLGVGAYRTAFRKPKALLGRQPETLGLAAVWVLPNPSGLNASYQAQDLVRLFQELRRAGEATQGKAKP
jgi:double-stranded uracil-DNA glycosylase